MANSVVPEATDLDLHLKVERSTKLRFKTSTCCRQLTVNKTYSQEFGGPSQTLLHIYAFWFLSSLFILSLALGLWLLIRPIKALDRFLNLNCSYVPSCCFLLFFFHALAGKTFCSILNCLKYSSIQSNLSEMQFLFSSPVYQKASCSFSWKT